MLYSFENVSLFLLYNMMCFILILLGAPNPIQLKLAQKYVICLGFHLFYIKA